MLRVALICCEGLQLQKAKLHSHTLGLLVTRTMPLPSQVAMPPRLYTLCLQVLVPLVENIGGRQDFAPGTGPFDSLGKTNRYKSLTSWISWSVSKPTTAWTTEESGFDFRQGQEIFQFFTASILVLEPNQPASVQWTPRVLQEQFTCKFLVVRNMPNSQKVMPELQ